MAQKEGYMTLKEALIKIELLEKENVNLKKELEIYRNRKISGRKKHDETWMKNYYDFEIMIESGRTMAEIIEIVDYSRRTAYRFKEYYDKIHGFQSESKENVDYGKKQYE